MSELTEPSSNNSCKTLENEDLLEVPISDEKYNEILNLQQETLSMVAEGEDANKILEHLCLLAERLLPNSVASIMLLDDHTNSINVLSAPSVPEVGIKALNGLKPGSGGGSCGNAIFRNEAQYVRNTFEDKRWENIRDIAYDFNLCSCWSAPVQDNEGKAIATFALSSFEHRSPSLFHKKLLDTAASIVKIILMNKEKNFRLKILSSGMQHSAEGMIITDKHNNIVEVNEAFRNIYGYQDEEVLGKNPKLLSAGKHNKKFYENMWSDILHKEYWHGEVINKKADGTLVEQWMSITPFKSEENEGIENYLAIFSDLTELKESEEKVKHLAFYDTLTGLYSKNYLDFICKDNTEETLILLNLDNFSYINTVYGYELGDKVLINIAKTLKSIVLVDTIFRISSDEFALHYDSEVDATKIVESIQNYFYANSIEVEGIILHTTFSYGIASCTDGLLQNAALALKHAKQSGKNRYHIFNKENDHINYEQREQFIKYNNILHKALEESCIVPFYQGIRDNRTRTIKKYEVLARIVLDDETIISPYLFLKPARIAGILPEITKVIIDKSFKDMARNDFTFSLNITEDDLLQNYLVTYLDEKSKEYNIESNRVTLEILEGISANGKRNHIEQLAILRNRGYKLAIDDFGVEYSNFERILDLEIDFLKIDAKYIKDIDTNEKSYGVASAIAYFAKNANIPCVAEFVHSESVQKVVDSLGVDFSQGFYFSEPSKSLSKKV